jgi:hypothetical protein
MVNVGTYPRGGFGMSGVVAGPREPRRPHADTLLRNHLNGDSQRAVAVQANVTKLSADWRTIMVRLALVSGISAHSLMIGMSLNLVIVALAAMVLWRLGRRRDVSPYPGGRDCGRRVGLRADTERRVLTWCRVTSCS